jgi:hypothetical protein
MPKQLGIDNETRVCLEPLKHWMVSYAPHLMRRLRYPRKPRMETVTIAAGFVHQNGIVLCSDTQQEAGASKYHGPKVGIVDIPYGKIAFAMAGHSDFATAAIQACSARLASVPPSDTIRVLAEVIESEYRRLVFTHPLFETDHNLPYWLLLAIWQESSNTCSMWVTQEHSLHSCFQGFRAVGIGTDMANVIMRPVENDPLSESDALTLMAYMMARVKDTVPSCGGISQYISIDNDGHVSALVNIALEEVEKVSALYDKEAHRLLLSMNDEDEETFNQRAASFLLQANSVRENWKRIRRSNPEVRRYLGLTTTERSRQQPSQE